VEMQETEDASSPLAKWVVRIGKNAFEHVWFTGGTPDNNWDSLDRDGHVSDITYTSRTVLIVIKKSGIILKSYI